MTLEEEWGLSAEFYPSKTINQVYPAQACHGLSAVCSHNKSSLAKHKPAGALMWTSNQFWIFEMNKTYSSMSERHGDPFRSRIYSPSTEFWKFCRFFSLLLTLSTAYQHNKISAKVIKMWNLLTKTGTKYCSELSTLSLCNTVLKSLLASRTQRVPERWWVNSNVPKVS